MTCTTDAFEEEGEAPVVLFELVVSTGEGGSVNTSGGSYESGSSVTITATPEPEYLFVGWTGTESTDNPLTITVNSNQEISPIFEKKKYQLSVNVTGEGTVTEEVINTGKTTDYDSGTVVKLTAVPTDGHAFFNWTNESALDTINPIQITVDGNKSIDVNFDYQTARDLVGEWEFELQDEVTAKSHGRILMRIDIRLNILFTLILNNQTTQIFSRLTTLSSTTMVMGGFGAFTNVSFKTTSSSSLSFNLITFPPSTPQPTSINSIPPPTPSNSLTLSGNKTSNNTAPIVPPATATTSTTAPTQTASSTNPLTGVVSQVNATVNPIACTISGTLTSGPQSQTVTASTAITNVVYTLSSNCTDTLSASATGLPSGVSLSFSNNTATISGSPSANSSGRFDYLINAVNSSGTASNSFNGSIIVVPPAAVVTSTTVTPCEITGTLTSGPQTQTVTATSAITNVVYTLSTTCTDTLTANATGLPTGVSMSFNNNIATISGTPSANASGTFSYSLTAVNAAATASSTFDGSIVVIPVPTVTATTTTSSCTISGSLTSAVGSDSQTVSMSTAITSIEYTLTTTCSDTFSAAIAWNPSTPNGISMSFSNNIATISGTPTGTATGTYNYTLTASNTAGTASATFSGALTLTDTVSTSSSSSTTTSCTITGSLTSANGSDSQTVSMSTVISSIEYTLTTTCSDTLSAAIAWTPSTPNGVSMSFSNNLGSAWSPRYVATISGTPTGTATGTYNYTLTASNTYGTASSSFTGSINVLSYTPSGTIYFDNGICKCPNSDIGFRQTVNGVEYVVVDDKTIRIKISNGNLNLCTTPVTDMSELFIESTFNSDIGFWDTSNVTTFYRIFDRAQAFNQDIGNWVTSSATNMARMFRQANNFNQNIGSWDTSNVTDMSTMFSGNNAFNQNIGGWDTSKVTNMSFMLHNTSNFNQNISSWDTSKVTDMSSMFGSTKKFNQDLSSWDTSSVTNMYGMFMDAQVFNSNIGDWDTSSVTNMQNMFLRALRFNRDISNWNTSNVEDMKSLFNSSPLFNQDISNWDTSSTTNMNFMFKDASAFNRDLSGWCVTNISSEPTSFSSNSPLTNTNKPVWGTCPTASCTISGTLTSANGSDSQTVSMSTAITNIEYTLTTTCSDTLSAAIAWTPSTPNGVSMSFSNNVATISGTPTGTATGTYNYTLTASNTAGTASATFSGSLTVSSSTTITSTPAPKTYVPDDNFEQVLIDLGHDDILDDYVITSNIVSLTLIGSYSGGTTFDNKGISDISGLEDFVSLKELYLGNNNITNTSPLTNLSNLEKLFLNSNSGISSITLNNLIALEQLQLTGVSNLSAIDLSNNVNLTNLNIPGTAITAIDLSNNTNLTNLQVGNNSGGLSSLDVSMLTNLERLTMAQGNTLSELDVSNCVNLTYFDTRNNSNLTCIVTSLDQISNYSNDQSFASNQCCTGWTRDDNQYYTIDCSIDTLGIQIEPGQGGTVLIKSRLQNQTVNAGQRLSYRGGYHPGEIVTLTATPDSGKTFAGWTCSAHCGSNSFTSSLTIDVLLETDQIEIQATFN
jgi:surface protein